MRRAFVLGCDFSYVDKLTTTLKSIVRYHQDAVIYILNTDFPQEWFIEIRRRLKLLNITIVDSRFNLEEFHLEKYQTHGHINYGAYFRYFIPSLIDEDKPLYLDCDLVVTANLDDLFELDLEDNYVAAVSDVLGKDPDFPCESYFNSGVMMINNRLWQREGMTHKLLSLTDAKNGQIHNGDQTILNLAFNQKWLHLDYNYNFQVGSEYYIPHNKKEEWIRPLQSLPKVIHYTTEKKPWAYDQFTRLREVWWEYYRMDWSDILLERMSRTLERPKLLVLTNSAYIEGIEYLLEALPECDICLGAWVNFSNSSYRLLAYENCKIYSRLFWQMKEQLVSEADILLDINHGREFDSVVNDFKEKNKPIFAFDNTAKYRDENISIFPKENPETMVEAIREYIKVKKGGL
ncbi:TPA: glycosyltransferase family 8 protein [Streptococcus agalactiae]